MPISIFKSSPKGSKPQHAVVMHPDGAEPRGFQNKNAYADQLNLLGPNVKTIFDIGANTGQTTARYLEIFPQANIHAFEPFPESFAKVQDGFRDEPRVTPYQLAISDRNEPQQFFSFTNSATNSLLPTSPQVHQFVAPDQIALQQTLSVECSTLDNFCTKKSVTQIDILKLDIQGGELRALKGAENLLREKRISLIYSEMLFVPIYAGQAWFFEIAEYLRSFGYDIYDFYNFSYAENGQLRWGDAIFRIVN